MLSTEFKRDLKISSEAVWYFLSAAVLALLIMTFFFPETLMKISPVCISKSLYGQECFMCGSTRAFIEITKGNFYKGFHLNQFSIVLFSLFFLNTVVFITRLILKPGRILHIKKIFLT